MRTRDDKKQVALFEATIKVVNEIGFAASSVSKIAEIAGVSPATLYIYFKNKEDLLLSTYLEIKKDIGRVMIDQIDDNLPVYDNLHNMWRNMFAYSIANLAEFRYTEQFSNSPYNKLVDKDELLVAYEPLSRLIRRGVEQRIIKDVGPDLFAAFMLHPILVLANPNHCLAFEPTDKNIELAFRMAWDALRI